MNRHFTYMYIIIISFWHSIHIHHYTYTYIVNWTPGKFVIILKCLCLVLVTAANIATVYSEAKTSVACMAGKALLEMSGLLRKTFGTVINIFTLEKFATYVWTSQCLANFTLINNQKFIQWKKLSHILGSQFCFWKEKPCRILYQSFIGCTSLTIWS